MQISGRHCAYVIALNIAIINSTLWCMQKKEEELQISSEQIKKEIKATTSLDDATNKYIDLYKRICSIFKGYYLEEERYDVLDELEKQYGEHFLHTKLPINNSHLMISGIELTNIYKTMINNLETLIKATAFSQSISSLPSIFIKDIFSDSSTHKQLTLAQQVEIINNTQKILQKYTPYHQKLAQGSDIFIRFEQLRDRVVTLYQKAMTSSGLMIDEWEDDKQPTCPYLLIDMMNNQPLYETEFRKFSLQQQKITKHLKQQEKINNKNQHDQLQKKLNKTWDKEIDVCTQKYTKELLNNFFPLIKQLNKIRQFAQAIQFDAEDGGIVGLNLKKSVNNKKRLQGLCTSLLLFSYPYMTKNEIEKALLAPFQPHDTIFPGFIDEYARKLNKQEAEIYLTIRDKTIKEVFKALDIFNSYKS